MLDAASVRLARLHLSRLPYCSSSGSSSQDMAKLIEYQTEGLIMLQVQVIYESTVPLLLVLVIGIGKNTNTMSHRMCMTKYSISKCMSHDISQQQVKT